MIWYPKLPFPYNLYNLAGEIPRSFGLPRLTADDLLEKATQKSGLTDFGDQTFLEGLNILIESLEKDANLSLIGRIFNSSLIDRCLRNRLLLVDAKKRSPEIFRQPLKPPIIIFGLPRTGTTYLHRLLALNSTYHAPPLWEVMHLIPNPNEPDNRYEVIEKEFKKYNRIIPNHKKMHLISANQPEECIIFDISYNDIVSKPIETVKNIYTHFKLIWSEDFEQNLNKYIKANPKNKFGEHNYDSAEFGLTNNQIKNEFAEYIDLFKNCL